MPSIHPGQIELERLMNAARNARSVAFHARVIALRDGFRNLLRLPTAIRPARTA